MKNNRDYAFQRYGWTMFYSLPSDQTFLLKNELGWKGNEPLDFYNLGAVECQNGNLKEAMKYFERAENQGCTAPELFFNIAAIHEEQQENLRMCPDCPGYWTIDSQALHQVGERYQVYCISVPVQGCPRCHKDAVELYEKMIAAPDRRFDFVYLQDRVDDVYRQFDVTRKQERVL